MLAKYSDEYFQSDDASGNLPKTGMMTKYKNTRDMNHHERSKLLADPF